MKPEDITKWISIVSALSPAVSAGILTIQQILKAFKASNPDATNDDLNAILRAVAAQGEAERHAIASELARLATMA